MPDRFQFILHNTNNIMVKIYNFNKTLNVNLLNSENQYISIKEQSQWNCSRISWEGHSNVIRCFWKGATIVSVRSLVTILKLNSNWKYDPVLSSMSSLDSIWTCHRETEREFCGMGQFPYKAKKRAVLPLIFFGENSS